MKKTFLSILVVLCLCFTLASCIINNDNSNNKTDDTEENKNQEGYKVTFTCDEHVTVYIYESQDTSSTATEATIAYSRDGSSGALLNDGNGQVNYKLLVEDGYEVLAENIVISGTYNQNKSLGNDTYRITKIGSNLAVTITATPVTENNTSEDEGYKVSFVCDEYVSVMVYQTQDMTSGGEQTDIAYSRESGTGKLTKLDGQVNFMLVFKDGYELAKIDITEGYNNLKGSADTGVENGYRITKITKDLTVTITSQKEDVEEDLSEGYEITFVCDPHTSIIVYQTQDTSSGGEQTDTAYSRDSALGKLLKDGNGQVNFKIVCEDGYEVLPENIEISGTYNQNKVLGDNVYRITKIGSNLTVTVTATDLPEDDPSEDEEPTYDEYEKAQALGVTIAYKSGTENCFSVENNVITFGTILEASVYEISGTLSGQIVIDVSDNYDFELSLQGLTISSDCECPLMILSASAVTLSAKNGTKNYIYDKRSDVSDDEEAYTAAVYSLVDLNLQGKGSLTVESTNNKGIHTKDDLSVKNLTLDVKCVDNALKGNDSVTITSGTITLIATGGDCIKTSNSSTSSKGKQKGTIAITGGTITLYAACDGIDAAYDVEISGDDTVLNIYTDKYSEYTGELASKSTTTMYLRITSSYYSSAYRYAFYFYNSSEDYKWAEATYYKSGTSSGGPGRNTYYYFTASMPTGYTNFKLYRFSASQTENSTESYNAVTSGATINSNYDMFCISSISSTTIKGSWSNYSSSSSMGCGMQDGNSNKSDYSAKGIKADNKINISGGTINIQSHDDGIHCDYGTELENDEKGVGILTISGGTITILTLDDAIHSDYKLIITDGEINITSSYEGLEANLIEIGGGEIYVVATDDGINASGNYATPCITVSGGYVDVLVGTGDCDGIDSNGNYVQTGGFVLSKDPTTQTGGMASGLDIDGTCTITGGTFICAGAIAETPSSSSECWVKFGSTSGMGWGSSSSSVTFTAGTYTVKDSTSTVLFTFTLNTSYKGMWIASDTFSKGESYTISNGSTTKSWTQSSNSATVS